MEATAQALCDETSEPFVGKWNTLVSTTNWEKGRIIQTWREALVTAGASQSEYADEAWARRVGQVSSQHVGRLRRVWERFGTAHEDYDQLFWSHFQAAIDWDDAEMWLEGAVQNQWSVSRMRSQRWEAIGAPAELKPRDEDIIISELDEDAAPAGDQPVAETIEPSVEVVRGDEAAGDGHDQAPVAEERMPAPHSEVDAAEPAERVRPFENLPSLPEDVQEAFEAFKLAILRHKVAQWDELPRADLLMTLDALKELVLAPADDASS